MAVSPQYTGTPKVGVGQLTTANANRDGTGTIGMIFTAGPKGSRIDALCLKATATTTTGMIRLFIHDGANSRLLTEVPVLAVTPGAASPSWEAQLNTNTMSQVLPIILPTGYSLRASTGKSETFNVIAVGGDF